MFAAGGVGSASIDRGFGGSGGGGRKMAVLAGRMVHGHLRFVAPILALIVVTAAFVGGSAGRTPSQAQHAARAGLPGMPLQARGPVSAALGADNPAYRVSSADGVLHASNPAAHLSSAFTREGVTVSNGTSRLGLRLSGVGRGGSVTTLRPAAPHAEQNRVLYDRGGGVSEWYANGPLGLEQGFTIARDPGGTAAAPLAVSLALSGSTHATLSADAQSIDFIANRKTVMRYTGLYVTDAGGRKLSSSLALTASGFSILVRDAGARYPLHIDPFVQDAGKLLPSGASGAIPRFGSSVAVSADGSTALVGAPWDNKSKGAVWVFTRSGSSWSQQGSKLVSRPGSPEEGEIGETKEGEFGSSVALSADGNTALIGAVGNQEDEGAVWVFKRSGSTWTQQGNPVLPRLGSGGTEGEPYESAESEFGASVSLSADGSAGLVGAPGAAYGVREGLAFVIGHGSFGWDFTAEMSPSDEAAPFESEFGRSVSLSADGKTALIGGPHDGASRLGAAWVFDKSGSAWVQHGAKLTGSEATGAKVQFGEGVALSGDGSTALIGGPGDNGGAGAVWAFANSGESWTQQGAKLIAAGETGAGQLGHAISLSASGNEALVGVPAEDGQSGAVWEFARSGEAWAQGEELVAHGEQGAGLFGQSVSLSADGASAFVGAPLENSSEGSARIFLTPGLPATITGEAAPVSMKTATLNASVNPNGNEVTECKFQYGLTASYGASVPCSSLPGSGTSPVSVSGAIAGLTPGTTYHFRILATNATGTNVGEDATFFSQPEPPTVVTGAATSVTSISATLNGTVDPNRGTVTECEFEYGASPSYGTTAPCNPLPGSGDSPVSVSAAATGLTTGSTYYFRLLATNAGGTSFGEQGSFVALAGPPEFGACLKVAAGAGLYANSGCTKLGGKKVYSWSASSAVGSTFTTKSTSAKIKLNSAVKGFTLECSSESGAGEYTSSKTVGGVTIVLGGCVRSGIPCSSPAALSGQIAFSTLEGVLGIEKLGADASKNKLALGLFPPGHSGPLAEFTCGSAASAIVRGSVIVALKANKMLLTQALKFKASGVKQKPEHFAEGGSEILEEQRGSGAFEQVGLSMTLTQTNSHEVEVNSIA